MKNYTQKKNVNNEVSLENLEISIEQAQIIQDDELKTVAGGAYNSQHSEWKCVPH